MISVRGVMLLNTNTHNLLNLTQVTHRLINCCPSVCLSVDSLYFYIVFYCISTLVVNKRLYKLVFVLLCAVTYNKQIS